ncbi:histidine kinase [Chromatium okenii]|uniref:HDOD domain-containing protein n=1 Tax=Chromatium okenii TaxID=61644 RepID=UPI001903107A|nr:HDOD domain-containing protein [Chromatium okenii]MBK1642564.1 histidine kinase [Chromatium okenii]
MLHYPSKQALETAFKLVRHTQVPQIPDVVLALRAELKRTEPDLRVLSDLIAQDVGLSGHILKKVNSPLFSRANKITSLSQAISLMGIKRLINLVTAEAVEQMLSSSTGAARVVWESVMEQAQIAVNVTRYVANTNPEDAYLFGIMHDVGSLIFAEQLPNYGYEWVLRASAPSSLLDYEQAALHIDHPTVGFLLASIWQLPEQFALAIFHHHDPHYQRLDDARVRCLIAITQLTHALMALPFGAQDEPEMALYRDAARLELELSEEDWMSLCKQIHNDSTAQN